MTPRELIKNLLEEGRHCLDEEIKVCIMSHTDDDVHVDFRISEVDENSIYIRERGVTSEKKMFKVPLPKDKALVKIYNRLYNE